jgi:hypothetical protein
MVICTLWEKDVIVIFRTTLWLLGGSNRVFGGFESDIKADGDRDILGSENALKARDQLSIQTDRRVDESITCYTLASSGGSSNKFWYIMGYIAKPQIKQGGKMSFSHKNNKIIQKNRK